MNTQDLNMNNNNRLNLLVTGAAGFIGSNFVHYWLNKYQNSKVVVVDALTCTNYYDPTSEH